MGTFPAKKEEEIDNPEPTVGDQIVEQLLDNSCAFGAYLGLKKRTSQSFIGFTEKEKETFIEKIHRREINGLENVPRELMPIIADNILAFGRALLVAEYISV